MNSYITFMVKGDHLSFSLSLYIKCIYIFFCEKKLPDITLIFGKIWRVKTQYWGGGAGHLPTLYETPAS